LATLPADSGNFRVNLTRSQLIGSERVDVILMLMMMTLGRHAHDDDAGSSAAINHKPSFFWLALFMICPSWVRAVKAETTLVIDLEADLMMNLL